MRPREVFERLPGVQVIDVRRPHEWEAGRIEAAVHIPLDELPERLGEVDPGRPVVAVCRTGNRSARAAELLRERGFDARNLDGGMMAWAAGGLPFTTPDGRAGEVVDSEPPPAGDLGINFKVFHDTLIDVTLALEERFGDREPTDEEVREFMRQRLLSEGRSPAEVERLLE